MVNISRTLGVMKFYKGDEEISPRVFTGDVLKELGEDISYEGCGYVFQTGVFTSCGKWSFGSNLTDYSFTRNALIAFMEKNLLTDIAITYVDTETGCDFIDIGSFNLNISGSYTYENVCESLREYTEAHGLPSMDVLPLLENISFYYSDAYCEQQYKFIEIVEDILVLDGYQEAVDYLHEKLNGDEPARIFIAKDDKSHGNYVLSEIFDFNYIKYSFIKDEVGDMISHHGLPVYKVCTEKEQKEKRKKLKEGIKSELNSLLRLETSKDLREEIVNNHLSKYKRSGLSKEDLNELKIEVI